MTDAGPADGGRDAAGRARRPGAHTLGLALLVLAVAFGTWARIDTAFDDPNFDRTSARGLLKSDPGLLYYITERIVEAGGGIPDDFRADPRVRYPFETDLAGHFAVGQEFVVAWAYLGADAVLARAPPLHVVAVIVMALAASLGAVGVYGLAWELTRRPLLAGMAAVLYASLPASYRTIGFILIREDFSFPWFLAHLWLAARAVRLRTRASIALAGAALGIAAATWHATAFFLALEAASVLVWTLRTGRNPLAARNAWVLPAVLVGFGVAVPVLREDGFVLSPPLLAVYGLAAAAFWNGRRPRAGRARRLRLAAVALGTVAAGLAVSLGLSRAFGGGLAESSHVFGLVAAKLRHLGRLPEDPLQLTPEVRLMWQGPFDTLDVAGWSELSLYAVAGVGLVVVVWTLRLLRRPPARSDDLVGPLLLLLAVSLPVAYLIGRTAILPGALLPVAAALFASRVHRGALGLGAVCALFGLFILGFLERHRITWYLPPQRQQELARLVEAVPAIVPPEAAVAADFMTSTAILAHTRRPILLQPKYEDRLSRERATRFLDALFRGTPDDVKRLLEGEGCRFLLVDRFTLWFVGRYAAGLPKNASAPLPGTAAAVFLAQDEDALRSVPGFRLRYRSPADIVQSNGAPTDFFRLYELTSPR